MSITLNVVEYVSGFSKPEKNLAGIKVRLDTGALAVFWGKTRTFLMDIKNMENIDTIKNKKFPLVVSIELDSESCIDAPSYMKRDNIQYSVSENLLITCKSVKA